MKSTEEDFPALDASREESSSSVCVTTPILEAILTGRVPEWLYQLLDGASEILVFRMQIRELEEKYSNHPAALESLRERLNRDVSLQQPCRELRNQRTLKAMARHVCTRHATSSRHSDFIIISRHELTPPVRHRSP